MPKISVIIPCYNANATIQSCLESVLQSKMKNFEIIVVDDASTDSSIDQIKKVQHQYPNKIKLLHLNKNSGPASARNKGAHEASGDSLFFLDSDTRILPSALSNFSKQIQNTDAVVGIYDKKPINSGVVPLYKALLNYYFFSRKGVIPYEVFDSSRAGIRRSVFESLRGFNETLTWGMDYENEEFGYRIVKSHRILLDPSIKVQHRFPNFKELTKNYFNRVQLWAEMFMKRKKFESGGLTSASTGMSSLALPLSLLSLALGLFIRPYGHLVSAVFFIIYLLGYIGFFSFILAGKKPCWIIPFLGLNIFFTCVISLGACYGVCRSLLGYKNVQL